MTNKPRSERLGLEPGSLDPHLNNDIPCDFEVQHSIAISLKRLADHFTQVERMTTYIRIADDEPKP